MTGYYSLSLITGICAIVATQAAIKVFDVAVIPGI